MCAKTSLSFPDSSLYLVSRMTFIRMQIEFKCSDFDFRWLKTHALIPLVGLCFWVGPICNMVKQTVGSWLFSYVILLTLLSTLGWETELRSRDQVVYVLYTWCFQEPGTHAHVHRHSFLRNLVMDYFFSKHIFMCLMGVIMCSARMCNPEVRIRCPPVILRQGLSRDQRSQMKLGWPAGESEDPPVLGL